MNTRAVHAALPSLAPLPSLLVPVMQALMEENMYLALGEGLTKAVVVEQDGQAARTQLTVESARVEDLVAWGHIRLARPGRIALYQITEMGRAVTPEAVLPPSTFRPVKDIKPQREHPVKILARKKMPNGDPFLEAEHVAAADFMSEDFRLSGFEEHPVGSMNELLEYVYPSETDGAILRSHERLVAALDALGPDLGDIALRCCCMGEGVETAERRMGWSARSGKIVLRIALRRLAMHYETVGAAYCCLM